MNLCKEFGEMIVRFFLKDLTKDEEKALNNHIGKCKKCKKEFLLQEEVESMLIKRPLSKAPVDIIERVLSIIPERQEIYERFHFNWKLAVCFSPVIVAWIITGFTIYFIYQPDVITTFIERVLTMMTRFPSVLKSLPFIIGVVIYSLLFSLSSLLFFWRSQLGQVQRVRIE